jgi:hypothetical protein
MPTRSWPSNKRGLRKRRGGIGASCNVAEISSVSGLSKMPVKRLHPTLAPLSRVLYAA